MVIGRMILSGGSIRICKLWVTSPYFFIHFEESLAALYSLWARSWNMKKSRYTDQQIAFALKQAETGTPVAEVIRRMGISEHFTVGRRCMASLVSVSCGV